MALLSVVFQAWFSNYILLRLKTKSERTMGGNRRDFRPRRSMVDQKWKLMFRMMDIVLLFKILKLIDIDQI